MAQLLCQELLGAIFEQCLHFESAAVASLQFNSGDSRQQSKRCASAQGTLCSAARVCKSWNLAATEALYHDPGPSISRYEGLYLPHLLKSLRSRADLREAVRSLTITASLEAGLWVSDFACEGDLFCELVELCPRLKSVTVPSFEVACRDRIVAALQNCVSMTSFNIRVYLESSRRDPRFAKLIPYDSWKLQLIAELMTCWPNLKEFTVRHIPDNSYHLIPDIVLKPPRKPQYSLPTHRAKLTTLSLRETFIDDTGLFHMLNGSQLTSLCLMSCQGITSSSITRQGLLDAIKYCGSTLQELTIMVPWLPYSAKSGEPDFVIDKAMQHCHRLRRLCVAGYDVTNDFIKALPNPHLIETLEIMDFELVTPQVVLDVASSDKEAKFTGLQRLAVWQRNAGVGRARVSNGWFKSVFGREDSPVVALLEKRGILLGTGWESRLISGSPIDFHPPRRAAMAFEELDRLSPV